MDRISWLITLVVLSSGCIAPPPQWPARYQPVDEAGPPVFRPSLASMWTGWDDALPPQVRFDRLRGWSAHPAPLVQLDRVNDAFNGHHWTVRLTATAQLSHVRVTLVPAAPIPLDEPADVVEVVAAAKSVFLQHSRSVPRLAVQLQDATGVMHSIDLGPIPSERWTILRAPLPITFRQYTEEDRFGWIHAIELHDWDPSAVPDLRLASLAVGLRHASLMQPPGQSDPPWQRPPDDHRVDATPPRIDATCILERLGDGHIALKSITEDGEATFVINPLMWHRNIEIRWNGRPRVHWRGWQWSSAAVDLSPTSIVTVDNRIELDTAGGWRVSIWLAGRTLSIRMRGPPSVLSISAAGWASSLSSERIHLPLMENLTIHTWHGAQAGEPVLFGTAWFDPFCSSASAMGDGSEQSSALETVRYQVADDGRAPAVDETFHLTISARVDDVLPSVPAVSGRRAADAAMSVYCEPGPFGTGRLREMWELKQAGPMFVLSEPSPSAPREDELDCTDPRWTREWVRHRPDGRWQEGSAPGRIAIKTLWMPTSSALGASLIEPADRALLPRVGFEPPWAFTDYDARVPGAATFRAAWNGLLDWLRLESRRRGAPVLCEAMRAWLYADAADAAAWDASRAVELIDQPWQPLVPLLRLNQALRLIAPPMPFSRPDADYHMLAATIAHGMALRLPPLDATDDRLWRWTFLTAALHRRQALQTVERLAWGTADGGLCSPSAALASDGWRRSRLYLRYRNGLEIWVNGDTNTWVVGVAGDTFDLPPAGWYAIGPNLLAASTLVHSRRLDRVHAPEYSYHDGHGNADVVDGIGSAEPVLLRFHEQPRGRRLRLTFLRAPASVTFGRPLWSGDVRLTQVAAFDAGGMRIAPPDAVRDDDHLRLLPPRAAREVELEWTR